MNSNNRKNPAKKTADRKFGRGSALIPRDAIAGKILPWVIAAMAYLASLALWGGLSLNNFTERFTAGLENVATVQLPSKSTRTNRANVTKIIRILKDEPGVSNARALTTSEQNALLEPWLGSGVNAGDLPIPPLIDVELDPEAPADLVALGAKISEAVPGTRIDNHRQWLSQLLKLANSLRFIALGIVVIVIVTTVVIVISATRAALTVHLDIIEIIHMIGARDQFMAREMQQLFLPLGLRGSLIGLAAAGLTLLVLSQFTSGLGGPMLPQQGAGSDIVGTLIVLGIVPVAVTALTIITARVTTLRLLARML